MLITMLHAAATKGDVGQLERVLSQSQARGSAASLVTLLQAADRNGLCAMQLAIRSGSTSMALRLLEAERRRRRHTSCHRRRDTADPK